MKQFFQRLNLPGPRHPICLYLHSVLEPMFPDSPGPPIFISPSEFRSALSVFTSRMQPTTLASLVANPTRNMTGPRALALTMDDGFRDNFTTVLPLLEEFDVAATIFVTTGFIDRETLPYELTLAKILALRDQLTVHLPTGRREYAAATKEEKNAAYRELTLIFKPTSTKCRELFLESLAPEDSVVKAIRDLYLDWDQLTQLNAHPLITIGAHSRTHLALAIQSPEVARSEMLECRNRLSAQLGNPIDTFAFPYGNHNCTTIAIAREIGFKMAVTTRRNYLKPSANTHAIPRCELCHSAAAYDYARGVLPY